MFLSQIDVRLRIVLGLLPALVFCQGVHPPVPTVPAPVPAAITPGPELGLRQDAGFSAGFIGWVTQSNQWFTSNCPPGESLSISGTYGICCQFGVGSCSIATGCSGNLMLYPGGGSGVCEADNVCDTFTRRIDSTGNAAQSMMTCIPSAQVFSVPNTFYLATFALSTPTVTVTQVVTTTVVSLRTTVSVSVSVSVTVSTATATAAAVTITPSQSRGLVIAGSYPDARLVAAVAAVAALLTIGLGT